MPPSLGRCRRLNRLNAQRARGLDKSGRQFVRDPAASHRSPIWDDQLVPKVVPGAQIADLGHTSRGRNPRMAADPMSQPDVADLLANPDAVLFRKKESDELLARLDLFTVPLWFFEKGVDPATTPRDKIKATT